MRIGLISDTHGRAVPADALAVFANVDRILHAGDIYDLATLAPLQAIAPVDAVAGNGDSPAIAAALGYRAVIVCGTTTIGLTHGHQGAGRSTLQRAITAFSFEAVDVIVFGHTHAPYCATHDGVLVVNPGSATVPRWQPFPSVAILTLDGAPTATIVPLGRPERAPRRGPFF